MIYIAAPYSDNDRNIVEQRFLALEKVVASMLISELPVFAPIIHCHEIMKQYNLPDAFDFWKKYCITLLQKSDVLYVLMLPGWDVSQGVQEEIAEAKRLGILIRYGDVEDWADVPKRNKKRVQ